FTNTLMDALCLKLLYPLWLKSDLPHKSWRPKWGSAGYEESRRWPLLPLGTMTDGDPVADEDARLWPLPLGMMKEADTIPHCEDNRSQKDEDNPSPEHDLIEDIKLALDVAGNPSREKELSRYEKLRLRDLFRHIS